MRAHAIVSAGAPLRHVYRGVLFFSVIYFVSNISIVARRRTLPKTAVESVRLTRAVKN